MSFFKLHDICIKMNDQRRKHRNKHLLVQGGIGETEQLLNFAEDINSIS